MSDDPQRIPFDWARVPCPTCGAQPDQRCRTLTTGRSTDAHRLRIRISDGTAVKCPHCTNICYGRTKWAASEQLEMHTRYVHSERMQGYRLAAQTVRA